jgi:TQXA domain-containing protein
MKKILSFIILIFITLGIVSPLTVKAEEVTGTDVYVYSAGKLTLLSREGVTLDIRKWTYNMADRYGTVRMYPAYCLNHGKRADSTNLVSIKEFTSNPKVWGIVTNGYLYRSNSALGVSTDEQAYSATQAALWAYAEGWDLSEITGDAATIAAMKTIYNAGMAKSSVTTPAVSVTPDSSTLAEDAIDNTYYSQTFTPKANVGVKSYTVKLGTNAPAGTIITDTTNNVKSTFSSTEKFKVLVPKTAIDGKSGNFKLDITAELQSNAVLFMTNSDPQYQNFAGGYDPYSFYDDTATVNYVAPDSPEPPTENPPTPSEPTPEPEPEPTPEPPTTTYLEIIKVEAGTEFPLSGATFRVTDNLGGIIGTFTTDSTGRIVVPITVAGSYSVDEITPPEGYLLDTITHQDIAISLDSPAVVTFTNKREPELEIRKIDSDSGQTLPGAVLRIASNDSFESIDVTTDNTGTAHITGLLPGNYTITEIAAPSGYILDDTHHDITLVAGETASITIGNKQKPGIVIKKYDEKTMQVLPGAEFSIAKKGGNIVYEGITDGNGIIRAEGLDAGWYTITEIAAPDGYLIATASKDVYLEAGKTVEVKFDNRLRPALTIVKLDAATGSPLSGAKFRVWKTEDLTVSEYTTDSTGKIVIHNLDEAIYSVEEIVPPGGYVSADETHRDITSSRK